MDPEVKKYFRKIINSFSIGFLWLFLIVTFGLYFQLGFINGKLQWYNYLFYLLLVLSFFFLAKYYYKLWKDDFRVSD